MLAIRNSSLGSEHFWGINEQLTFTALRQDSSSLLENPRKALGSLDHDCLIIMVSSWEGISGVAMIQWSCSTLARHRGAPYFLSFFVMSWGMDLATEMEIEMVLSSLGWVSEKAKQKCIIFRTSTVPETGAQKPLLLKEHGFRLKTWLSG